MKAMHHPSGKSNDSAQIDITNTKIRDKYIDRSSRYTSQPSTVSQGKNEGARAVLAA